MSREYIISVPDDAGFVEYSYIRGGRKYNTHYAYKSMERLVRCKECIWFDTDNTGEGYCTYVKGLADAKADGFCSYGERSSE